MTIRRMLILSVLAVPGAAGILSVATAQTSDAVDAREAQVFRSGADLVVLHVNVFDDRSDAVDALPQSAFTVFEDERPQQITFFTGTDVPVAAGLIIDNSSSMIARRNMVSASTRAFVESSHPEDELFTISFNEYVAHGLPDTVPFTQNRTLLTAAATHFPAGGKTALFDAVIAGLEHLERSAHQKRVLVVISDGDDNASRHTEKDMLERAQRSNAIIYTVATIDLVRGLEGNGDVLKKLAQLSGGVSYAPRTEADVVRALETIAGNIRRGYSIGYTPERPAAEGGFRRVRVAVHVPGRSHLTVRARNGYRASPPNPSTTE